MCGEGCTVSKLEPCCYILQRGQEQILHSNMVEEIEGQLSEVCFFFPKNKKQALMLLMK
jgi:hypothetical protein